jgi:outer membrane protein assembly factor BamB
MKILNILFKTFILCFLSGLLLSACGYSRGSGDSNVQVLVSWTDESTDSAIPVTNLRMVKIATRATNSTSPLTSTTVVVNGTLTNVSDIKVWWSTEDNFATATQVGEKDSPAVDEAYTITLTGAGNASGFLYYTISIPDGQSGTYSMSVLSIAGTDADFIPLPQSTASRNITGSTESKELPWSFKTGGAIHTVPAIGNDGTIYVSSDDHFLYAINPDGTKKWSYETGDVLSSPAIGSDGTIYVGSNDRQLYAINPDGTLKWVYPTFSLLVSSPAIGIDGTIYFGGPDLDITLYPICGELIAVQFSHLYAITPSGTLKWSIALSGRMDSSPAVGTDGIIYVGTDGDIDFDKVYDCGKFVSPGIGRVTVPASNADPNYPVNGHLYAIYPTHGTIKWDFKTLGDVNSSPAIGSDGTIYVGSDAYDRVFDIDGNVTSISKPQTIGYLYAINPSGTLRWLYDRSFGLYGDVDSSPAIGSDGTIYVGSDKNDVFALNPNGTLKWVYPTRGDVNSSPAIDSEGMIYVGSDDKRLYALNPDGTLNWVLETGDKVNSSPAIGNDGTIYIGSDDGNLYAVAGNGALSDSPWPKFHHDLKNTGRK